ncbi:MAG TPA: TonB-dependent receptor [Steroidobacteraceae bacterium]|nr:TonB-dependent receptor [Steroidobacteraceae bacterium]
MIDVGPIVRAYTRIGAKPFTRMLGLMLALSSMTVAETSDPVAPPDTAPTAKPAAAQKKAGGADQESTLDSVYVEGKRWLFNRRTRYAHSLPEVDGPTITVTKKTSVVQLADVPTIIDNNQRELFDRLPGIVLAEQQNPTELNLSYRGLGNPQESEYVLLMQDGIPLEMDWIGYPTIYYIPVPQTLGSVQMIRAGSGLLYGPEPQPVINFISQQPSARPLAGTTEQVGGSNSLFSSFNKISGTNGNWNYLADFSRRQSDGQRQNGGYVLNAGDLHLGYLFDAQKLTLDFHAYSLDSGLAGLMSGAQFLANRNQTTTPDDHLWADRYTTVLTYENKFTDKDSYTQKLWSGYQDLWTRSDTYADVPPVGTGGTLSGQRFNYTGLDGRWLHRWGAGNALTVGYTLYTSRSPYNEWLTTNPVINKDDESGIPFYDDERKTTYGALFAENVFRFEYFHLVTSARFDHEVLDSNESLAPHPSLVNETYTKNIPLFGIGIGNDFGHGNETYLNVSQGFRPLRYLDIASPFSNFSSTNNPDPTKYLTYEAGVHGWPRVGLYYDVSVFQVNVKDRIESQQLTQTETIDVNTGNTRSRGIELEAHYDLLRLLSTIGSNIHLDAFANASLLDARFTSSIVPGQTGKIPAYAPHGVFKAGITAREDDRYKVSLVANTVGSQYFQDSDRSIGSTPAHIPTYTVADLAGDYVIAGHLRLLGGISNLANRHYYSRVFLFGGMLEPASDRSIYAGAAYDF